MIYYTKEAVELLHLISEQKKGVPIITVFDIEAQSYKYGEKAYCNIIKKQITDAFEFTAMYADRELNLSFDDYVNLYILDPDSKAELKILNELLEHLQNYTIKKEQAPEPQIKQGRPKTIIHDASYYLYNKELLQFLIDNYSNTTPQIFNQLLSVLADIEVNQLKPATKKEYKEAFGKALNVKQRQSNFDNYFNTIKIDEIFEPIKATIKTYLNGN